MNKDMIMGFVRHTLTFVGGAVGITAVMGEEATTAAIGALATLVGFVWSYLDKKKREPVE